MAVLRQNAIIRISDQINELRVYSVAAHPFGDIAFPGILGIAGGGLQGITVDAGVKIPMILVGSYTLAAVPLVLRKNSGSFVMQGQIEGWGAR